MASALCCSMADNYRQQKDYSQAEKCMREYETLSGFFDESGNIERGKEMYYFLKGQLCLDTSEKEEAEHYFRKLLEVANNYDQKIAALDGLQQFYANYFIKDSLVKYDRLSDSLCSIAHSEVEMQKTLQVQALYDYTQSEKIAHQKKQEADRLRFSLIIVVAICIILILLSLLVYVRHINARKLLESKYRSEQEKLAQAQTDLLALRSEQSVSDRLLTQKEQEMRALQESVEQYRNKIRSLQGYAINDRLQQAPITRRLKQYLKENPYRIPDYQDWNELKLLVNHELPSFYDTLVGAHNLNSFEYDVCMLLRIQVSPANIAKLKKCSAAYITQIRKAVYKKIFMKAGLAEDLDTYIMSLS